ncbi:MarR family transcriptional regulator [Nocardioides sp. BP30]|uniref:MarR family winged helix-turn-helix transcriptional regulator n=1 Tax=Nocardioides sp. BP30 TaxID=3036374 RepID=UPI002469B080|nr:MarR family transcriptional regulator [Nocardioides sp. BP30]WGL50356.1 MarR family transcriptional regulator [Nocardioides sp. BP30]
MDEERDRALAEELRLAVGSLVRATRAQTDELSRAHAESLAQLERQGGRTIALLAAERGVSHQAMSKAVAELERMGLVERHPHPSDARAFVIELSASGRHALRRDRDARRDSLARAIAGLDEADRALLDAVPRLLRRLMP